MGTGLEPEPEPGGWPREVLLWEELLPRGGAPKLQLATRLFGNLSQLAGRELALSSPRRIWLVGPTLDCGMDVVLFQVLPLLLAS